MPAAPVSAKARWQGRLTRGWRGEARSTALQTRPRARASSSATNEARAERNGHCALISGEAQGDGAVRIEPRMRAPQIGGSRSRLILMRGCRGSLVIDRLLLGRSATVRRRAQVDRLRPVSARRSDKSVEPLIRAPITKSTVGRRRRNALSSPASDHKSTPKR